MAIDRSFIVQGHGTVVTGSVTAGTSANRRRGRMAAARRAGPRALACRTTIAGRGGPPRDAGGDQPGRRPPRGRGSRPGVGHAGIPAAVARADGSAALPGDVKRPIKHRARFASTSARRRSWAPCRCSIAMPSSRAVGPGAGVPRRAGDGGLGPAVRGPRLVGDADARRRPGLAADGQEDPPPPPRNPRAHRASLDRRPPKSAS